jgi:hypothetical protein
MVLKYMSAEVHEVVDDAHPRPEEGQYHADGLARVACRLHGKDDRGDTQEIGENVHRPDGLIVLLKDLQELVNGKGKHTIPPFYP